MTILSFVTLYKLGTCLLCLLSLNDVKIGVTDGEDAPPNNLVSRCGLTPQDEQFKHQYHGWRHTGLGWQHCVDTLVKLEGEGLSLWRQCKLHNSYMYIALKGKEVDIGDNNLCITLISVS